MYRTIIFFFIILKSSIGLSQGYDVFGVGIYDVKFDGSSSKNATDIRYERRFDNTIIDIGPEGGYGGGQVVASGTPEDVAKVKASYTGQYLKKLLKPKKSAAAKKPSAKPKKAVAKPKKAAE